MSDGLKEQSTPGWVSEFMGRFQKRHDTTPPAERKQRKECAEQEAQSAGRAANDQAFRDMVIRFAKTFEGQETPDAIAKKKIIQDFLDRTAKDATEAQASQPASPSLPDACIPVSGLQPAAPQHIADMGQLLVNAGLTEWLKTEGAPAQAPKANAFKQAPAIQTAEDGERGKGQSKLPEQSFSPSTKDAAPPLDRKPGEAIPFMQFHRFQPFELPPGQCTPPAWRQPLSDHKERKGCGI
jgi:hypothetical protein